MNSAVSPDESTMPDDSKLLLCIPDTPHRCGVMGLKIQALFESINKVARVNHMYSIYLQHGMHSVISGDEITNPEDSKILNLIPLRYIWKAWGSEF